jgi:hypothetical protein
VLLLAGGSLATVTFSTTLPFSTHAVCIQGAACQGYSGSDADATSARTKPRRVHDRQLLGCMAGCTHLGNISHTARHLYVALDKLQGRKQMCMGSRR